MLQASMSLSLLPLLCQAIRKKRRKASLLSRKLCQQSVQCQKMCLYQIIFDSNDDLNLDVNLKEDGETHSFVSCNKTRLAFVYDDDTAPLTYVDSTTGRLLQIKDTVENSAGNVFLIASETE